MKPPTATKTSSQSVRETAIAHPIAHAAPIDANPGRGVGLGIDVDQEHLAAHLGERCAHTDSRGGLSDAPLLVGDREDGRWHG